MINCGHEHCSSINGSPSLSVALAALATLINFDSIMKKKCEDDGRGNPISRGEIDKLKFT